MMSTRTLQLGVIASALADDPRRAPTLARAAGFSGLLFDAVSPALDIPDLSLSGRREFRRILSAHEQQLVGLRSDLESRGFTPGADVDRILHRLDRAMEAAAGLNAPLVSIDLGPLPAPPREPLAARRIPPEQAGVIIIPTPGTIPPDVEPPPPPPDPALVSQVDAALAELGRRADRYNVTLALRSDLASFAALERALRAADCPWFGLDLDPVAILRDRWDIDQVFSRLGSLIRHVRARDAAAGADRRTRPAAVGQGSLDWQELLAALDDVGYRSWITIDPTELPNRPAAAAAALHHLQESAR